MKKFEAKTTLLLALPVLVLAALASLLSLRQTSSAEPQLVTHELVRVPNTRLLCYRVVVTKNEFPYWSRALLRECEFGVKVQPAKCDQLSYTMFRESENANYLTAERFFDSSGLKNEAVLRTMITWKQSANSSTRDRSHVLRETISLQDLK